MLAVCISRVGGMLPVVEDCMVAACRRQRAKQSQEKLMKEFASKQKQFMEKVVGSSGMYTVNDNDSVAAPGFTIWEV